MRFDLYKGSYNKTDSCGAERSKKFLGATKTRSGNPGNVCDAEEGVTRAEDMACRATAVSLLRVARSTLDA